MEEKIPSFREFHKTDLDNLGHSREWKSPAYSRKGNSGSCHFATLCDIPI